VQVADVAAELIFAELLESIIEMKRDDQQAICLAAFIAELQDDPSGAAGDV